MQNKKKKVLKMRKVRKRKMWGKLRGSNSMSDEIPHPNCDIEVYGCSSPLTFFLNEAAKNGGKANNFTGMEKWVRVTIQKQMIVWRRRRRNDEENELKRSWFLFVVLRKWIKWEDGKWRWEMNQCKSRNSQLSFFLYIVHQNVLFFYFLI